MSDLIKGRRYRRDRGVGSKKKRTRAIFIMAGLTVLLAVILGLALGLTLDRSHAHPTSSSSSGSSSDSNKNKPPNVLVIMSDDQDLLMDSMSVQPNVKSLIGSQGITYDSHYCTVAWCCPSRVNFFTGRAAHNTNVTAIAPPQGGWPKFYSNGLNENWLPVWLQESSINTYYVGKLMNSFTLKDHNNHTPLGWNHSQFLVDPYTYQYTNSEWTNDDDDTLSAKDTRHTTVITQERSLAMLEEAAAADQQFFMMVAPVAPHVQTAPKMSANPPAPPGYENMFLDRTANVSANWNPDSPSGASWVLDLPQRKQDELDVFNTLYVHRLQNIAGVDGMVAAIIQKLDDLDILDNTYVIYTTDNGFHIGNHRLTPGKQEGYEEDINIPLLIRGPDVPKNVQFSSFSSHTDMAPTILDMLGVPLRDDFDGSVIPYKTSSSPIASTELVNVEFWQNWNTAEPENDAQFETSPRRSADITPQYRMYSVDIEGDAMTESQKYNNTYKSLRLQTPSQSFYYSVWCDGSHELYDMNSDVIQMNNLLGSNADTTGTTYFGRSVSQLTARLDALLMVTKSCKMDVCRSPWSTLFPNDQVTDLESAMSQQYDSFFNNQPQVSFDDCQGSYIPALEGPQKANAYSG